MVRTFLLMGAVALFFVAGCIDFNYVGREFAPTPISEPVAYYVNRELVPAGEFRIMGRATVTAPDGTDGYDIQELLLKKARAFGADAVCLVRARKVPVGMYEREEVTQGPQFPLDPANVMFSGAPEPLAAEMQEYGAPETLSGERNSRIEVVIEALYLKKKAALEQLTAEQGRELEEILGAPSEPSRPPASAPEKAPVRADEGLVVKETVKLPAEGAPTVTETVELPPETPAQE